MAAKPEPLYLGEPLDGGDLAEELVPDSPVNQGEIDLLSQGSGLMKVGEDDSSCLQLPAPGANNFDNLDREAISTRRPASSQEVLEQLVYPGATPGDTENPRPGYKSQYDGRASH